MALRTIDKKFKLDIINGQGSFSSDKMPTFGITISGQAKIISPEHGTWSITINDAISDKIIFQQKNVKADQPLPFTHKTGFQTQINIEAAWSEMANTTLEVQIAAKY